jgi:hypothetical protein
MTKTMIDIRDAGIFLPTYFGLPIERSSENQALF